MPDACCAGCRRGLTTTPLHTCGGKRSSSRRPSPKCWSRRRLGGATSKFQGLLHRSQGPLVCLRSIGWSNATRRPAMFSSFYVSRYGRNEILQTSAVFDSSIKLSSAFTILVFNCSLFAAADPLYRERHRLLDIVGRFYIIPVLSRTRWMVGLHLGEFSERIRERCRFINRIVIIT